MGRLFGTDGIRGVANRPPITVETAIAVGRAVAAQAVRDGGRPSILIGKDTRQSSDMLESALAAGVTSMGADALLAGVIGTPAVAYLTRRRGAAAGVVISASHNEFEDNGIKVFSAQGTKLPDAAEAEIERLMAGGDRPEGPTHGGIGRVRLLADAQAEYSAFACQTLPTGVDLRGLRLGLDCANGATSGVAPAIFGGLGANVTAIHVEPDGTNINRDCGSQHTASLAALVRGERLDAGLAFDGDGDRVIAVDETGAELQGDEIVAACARMYLKQGRLANQTVVTTVMSNAGFGAAMRRLGIRHVMSQVGDRYVRETMDREGAVMGGEDSGHIIFADRHSTGDGIVSGIQLLAAMRLAGEPLSALGRTMVRFPQKMVNVPVARKPPLEREIAIAEAIRAAEALLGENGRVLVRYSGTQALCRVMVEGPTAEMAAALCDSVADAVRRALG
jgi:phosphoglucosamine mutase